MRRMPGPVMEAMTYYAGILITVLFIVVAIALLRNWVDSLNPSQAQTNRPIDIRQLNSAGAARLMLGDRDRER